jgi:hypothetical protein
MKRVGLLLVLSVVTALGVVKAYDVEVYRNFTARTDSVPPNNQIAQYFRMCVDSLTKVSLWVGDTTDAGLFSVEVRDSATDLVIASKSDVPAGGQWKWVDFAVTATANKPIKGRTYKAVFTRSGGAEIEYAYNPLDPYKYGQIVVDGGESPPPEPLTADLACRIFGVMDPVDSTYWGAELAPSV